MRFLSSCCGGCSGASARAELIIGLFTAFFATYVVLTFVGQFMRGHGMHLFPPGMLPETDYGMLLRTLGLA